MIRKTLYTTLILTAALAAARGTNATPQICPIVAPENWISVEQVKSLTLDLGYDIVHFVQPEGGCWVAFSEKEGVRYEIYFHPGTGGVVRTERKQN